MKYSVGTTVQHLEDIKQDRIGRKSLLETEGWAELMDKTNSWVILDVQELTSRSMSNIRNRVVRLKKQTKDYTFTSMIDANQIVFLGKKL